MASTVSASSSECDSLPANVDITKLSNADLDRYGLPYRGSMPLAKWESIVDSAGQHVCGHLVDGKRISGGRNRTYGYPTLNWAGNVADGVDGPYSEADAVYYVPTIASNSPVGVSAEWVGIGGAGGVIPGGGDGLTQAGVDAIKNSNGSTTYEAWVENLLATYKDSPTCGPNVCILESQYYPVTAGDRIQVVVTQNQMYIGDGGSSSHGSWSFEATYGPYPDDKTAEWIVEAYEYPGNLCNFQSVTFYGMGDTQGNGTYTGPFWQTHDFTKLQNNNGQNLVSVGPLIYNTTFGPPDDSNEITWIMSQ